MQEKSQKVNVNHHQTMGKYKIIINISNFDFNLISNTNFDLALIVHCHDLAMSLLVSNTLTFKRPLLLLSELTLNFVIVLFELNV